MSEHIYKSYSEIANDRTRGNIAKAYFFLDTEFNIYSDSDHLIKEVDKYVAPHMQNSIQQETKEVWNIFYLNGKVDVVQNRTEKILGIYGVESVLLAKTHEDDNGITFWGNNESGNEIVLNRTTREGYVIYNSEIITLAVIEDCYAIVRNICYEILKKKNAILLHGCAMKYNNKGILFIGEKGAGKTSIQHYALQELGAGFISSDRTFIWKEEDKIFCSGWMSTYRINIDLLKLLPENEKTRQLEKYYERKREDPFYFQNNKIRIAPQELASFIRCSVAGIATLNCIVLLGEGLNEKKYALKVLQHEEVIGSLIEHVIDPYSYNRECSKGLNDINEIRACIESDTKIYGLTGRDKLDNIKILLDMMSEG